MNKRQEINKILHTHIDVNKNEDYTNYKALITAIENWHESEIKKLNLHDVSGSLLTLKCDKCYLLGDDAPCDECYAKQ
jgi:hypothetical protein